MGMRADVTVIGPFFALNKADVLDYPFDYYEGVHALDIVIGTVAVAATTSQSNLLAEVCGVDPWSLGNHRITTTINNEKYEEWIGQDKVTDVIRRLQELLSYDDVILMYRPNG